MLFIFFFFKQKTAYEMRISDWSSDVCSSDLEWDNRHFWRVSNAEHLELSENVGMVNLSHFAIYDVSGRDAERLMEYVSSSKVAGDTPVGKGAYTNFLDAAGGVQADLTVLRLAEDRFRVIAGGDAGTRDATYLRRLTQDKEWSAFGEERTDHPGCIALLGQNARPRLKKLTPDPDGPPPHN